MKAKRAIWGTFGATFTIFVLAATPTKASEEWEFALSPLFLWGLSIDGDATINNETAPLELGFTDEILQNMEAVFTVHFEARRGRLGFFTEYQYVDLKPEVDISQGPLSVDDKIDFEEDFWEIGATWAVFENDRTRWEILGGARYTDQEITMDIEAILDLPPDPERDTELKGGDDWWHGFGGVRLQHRLGDKWSVIARTDYGYADSDNTAFNLEFMFDYRFRDWGSAFIGARYLDYDYEEEKGNITEYAFDAAKQGPLAGVKLHW